MDNTTQLEQALVVRSRGTQNNAELEQTKKNHNAAIRLQLNNRVVSYIQSLKLPRFPIVPIKMGNPSNQKPVLPISEETCIPILPSSRNATLGTLSQARTSAGNYCRNEVVPEQPRTRVAQGQVVRKRRMLGKSKMKPKEKTNPAKYQHDRRQQTLKKILDPIFGGDHIDSTSILLCWGKHDDCRVLPVKLSASANTVPTWESIKQTWYEQRGKLRAKIPFFGVQKVSVVMVGDLGLDRAWTVLTATLRLRLQDANSRTHQRASFTAHT
jgi:hypothetical protein